MVDEKSLALLTGGKNYENLPPYMQQIVDCVVDVRVTPMALHNQAMQGDHGSNTFEGMCADKQAGQTGPSDKDPLVTLSLTLDESMVDAIAARSAISGMQVLEQMRHCLALEFSDRGGFVFRSIESATAGEDGITEEAYAQMSDRDKIIIDNYFTSFGRSNDSGNYNISLAVDSRCLKMDLGQQEDRAGSNARSDGGITPHPRISCAADIAQFPLERSAGRGE